MESNHKDHRGDDGIEPCFQHSPKMCFDLRVNIPFINCGTDCIETIPHPLQGYVTDHLHHCSIFCGSRGNPTLTTRLNAFTIFKIANLCPLGTSIFVGKVGFEPTFSTSYLSRVYQTRWILAVILVVKVGFEPTYTNYPFNACV